MTHPRNWSNRAFVTFAVAVVFLLLLATLVDLPTVDAPVPETVVKFAPVGAVLVALVSLIVTAVSSVALVRRQRRQATLEAWTDWSDACGEARRNLSRNLGFGEMTTDQAQALVEKARTFVTHEGAEIDAAARAALLSDVVLVLNGLERLAAGASSRVYDREMLRTLGATIIVRSYTRLEPYVEVRRNASDKTLRQKLAFVELEALVTSLRHEELDTDRLSAMKATKRGR